MKIKNLSPKWKEFTRLNKCGEITLKKDVDFYVLCFDINFDGYFPAQILLWLQNYLTAPPTPVSDISSADSGYECQQNIFLAKKMIQIIVCSCTKPKFRNAGITSYSQQTFNTYVEPYPRHLLFKERYGNVNADISCKYLGLKRG